jgi:hypothetical protein
MQQAIHAFVNFCLQVVVVHDLGGYQIDQDSEVLRAIQGCVEIKLVIPMVQNFSLVVEIMLLSRILVVSSSAVQVLLSPG